MQIYIRKSSIYTRTLKTITEMILFQNAGTYKKIRDKSCSKMQIYIRKSVSTFPQLLWNYLLAKEFQSSFFVNKLDDEDPQPSS